MMVVEPIDYSASTGRALLQGLTAGRAIQGIRQSSQEMADAAAAKERQNSAYSALQNARPEDLPTLRKQYPEFADVIQKEIGIQDAEHSTFVNKALNNLSVAYSSGNPQIMQQAIQAAKPALASMNVPADEAWQLYQSDPKQFGSLLKTSMYATMPFEKQAEIAQKQAELQEDARQADMQNDTTRKGQRLSYGAQMARLNHDKYVYRQSQAALDKYGQAQDMDTLALNSQIASTGVDPLTKKPATGARMTQARKWLEGNNGYNEALITGERGIEKIDSVLDKPELEGIGRYAGRMPDATTSEEGLANRNAIEELKSGAFVQNVQMLRGMGSLSNAEGSKLENLIARLDVTQPEDVVRKQLSEIRSQYSVLQKVAGREAESMGYSSQGYDTYVSERKSQKDQQQEGSQQPATTQQQAQQPNYNSLWGG
ncbi:TPA: DNA injection protein [Citrobacter freundii]|nr:DNA injection protein [Citrobacter freundii]MDN4261745.1 DNA injection protein [Citrobacter freundii]HCB1585998.1 phage DNA ejection protein [Citrobacter freundii]HEE9902622.1 phage DNA ejection protein [Citrobacter freundii]